MSAKSKKREPEVPREFNTRNTHDWCKGRKGIEHQYEWKPATPTYLGTRLPSAEEQVCSVCGRKTNYRRKNYTLGFLVSYYRRACAMTVRDLAEKAGVDFSKIIAIESEATKPTPDVIRLMAKALGVRCTIRFDNQAVVETIREDSMY